MIELHPEFEHWAVQEKLTAMKESSPPKSKRRINVKTSYDEANKMQRKKRRPGVEAEAAESADVNGSMGSGTAEPDAATKSVNKPLVEGGFMAGLVQR